jgi:hypothetical protein
VESCQKGNIQLERTRIRQLREEGQAILSIRERILRVLHDYIVFFKREDELEKIVLTAASDQGN